jgi:predicted nucleotidyltransferase component of viral defense system
MKDYSNPSSFKAALEAKLRVKSGGGPSLERARQLVVFDRFLARIVRVFGDAVILKGGLALEMRTHGVRTTKDVDLSVSGSRDAILERLQASGRLDLGEYFVFEIGEDPVHPTINNDGMQYTGVRFRAQCKLAGRKYGWPFGIDVAFEKPVFGEPEELEADDILDFAGIAPPKLRVYPIETHIAEKLHAYTMPRSRPNSRVKDLPDLALLARVDGAQLMAERLREAIEKTFLSRATHHVPKALPEPPKDWETRYADLRQENDLPWATLADVHAASCAFIDPVLNDELCGSWEIATQRWVML